MRPQAAPAIGVPATALPAASLRSVGMTGKRRALCIGIDRYPTAPLGGCANDARQWRETLLNLGFEDPRLLLDGEATRSGILGNLTELIRSSRPGDVLVFQYSGHGTQLRDLNGDETDGDSPGLDEALCPIDFADGRFLIDDDLATVFDQAPAGVSMTVFYGLLPFRDDHTFRDRNAGRTHDRVRKSSLYPLDSADGGRTCCIP